MLSDKRHVPFPPKVLMCLIETVLRQMSGIPAPQRKFITVLLTTWMCGRGKVNYRNLSRYSEIHEKTYSRWFRVTVHRPPLDMIGRAWRREEFVV
jgi:hypothetical protein